MLALVRRSARCHRSIMEKLRKRNRACLLCICLVVLSAACASIQNSPSTYEQQQKVPAQHSALPSRDGTPNNTQNQKQNETTSAEESGTEPEDIESRVVDGDQSTQEPRAGTQPEQESPDNQLAESLDLDPNATVAPPKNDARTDNETSPTEFSLADQKALAPDQQNTALSQDDAPPANGLTQTGTKAISFQQVQSGDPDSIAGPVLSDVERPAPSYLIAGFNIDEFADLTPANGPSNPFQEYSVPRAIGVLNLVKKTRRFDTTIGYKGGVVLNQDSGYPLFGHTIQQVVAGEKISWSRTSLVFQNYLSDGPGASFGSSESGGASASNLGSGGNTGTSDYYGTNDYGGFRAQHLNDTAVGQVGYMLSPRANLIFSGAFSTVHYFSAKAIDSQQTTALGGYNYALTQKEQLGVSYGYQYWSYPGSAATSASTVQVNYLRDLSPRMKVSLAAGPQFLRTQTIQDVVLGPVTIPVPVTLHEDGYTAGGSLGYTSSVNQRVLGYYQHLVTSGSGLFEGASTDVVEVSGTRNLMSRFATNLSVGFTRLSSVQKNSSSAIIGSTYQYWFASAGVLKPIGRHWSMFGGYQFNDQTASSGCAISSACGSRLHTLLLSITWRSLPIGLGRGNGENGETLETAPVVLNPLVDPVSSIPAIPAASAGEPKN